MKTNDKFAVVGAGGIACYLVPMLARLGDVVIIDNDNYEPKNSTRQFPALKSTGNKAEVLAGYIQPTTLNKITYIKDFFKGIGIRNHSEWDEIDFIFGAVDNNKSRRIIADYCDDFDVPGILAGNGEWFGDAHLVLPGIYNPFDHFEFPDTDPAPWACNSDKALETTPQTAIANMMAAGAAMHIFLSIKKTSNKGNIIAHVRNDTNMGIVKRVRELQKEKTNEHTSTT